MSSSGTVNPFFTPTQISGCALWLDAADSTTLVMSDANVSQWTDKSGTANNAILSTRFSWLGPTVTASKALRFTRIAGTSLQMLRTQTGRQTTIACTQFVVLRYLNDNPTSYLFDLRKTSNASVFANISRGGANLQGTAGAKSFTYSVPTTFTILCLQHNTNRAEYYANGTLIELFTGTLTMPATDTGYTTIGALTDINFGGGATAANQVFYTPSSEMLEITMYNAFLTTQQRQQVEGYLAWKWGLQGNLPATHPYKNSIIPPFLNPPTTLPLVLQNTQATFLPNQVSGCQLWLDAADPSTITLSGANVSQWRDKSGNGFTLTATGTPILQPFNGLNVILMNNGPYFQNNSFLNSGPYAVFYMMKFNSIAISGSLWQTLTDNVSPLRPYIGFEGNSGLRTSMQYGGTATLNPEIWSLQYSTTNVTVFNVNGSNSMGASTGYGGVGHTNGIRVGFAGNSTAPLNGWIGEILFIGGTLTTIQFQQVEGYLAWKWGLQGNLPANHPYKLGPPYSTTITAPSRSLVLATGWQPSQVSGLSLWLDASDRSTLVLTGANVTTWRDKSGNGYNATGTGNTTLTTFNTKYTGIRLDGSTTYFNYTGVSAINTTNFLSAFVVATFGNMGASEYRRLLSFGNPDFNNTANAVAFNRNNISNQIIYERSGLPTPVITLTPPADFFGATLFTPSGTTQFINSSFNASSIGSFGAFNYLLYNVGRYSGGGYNWTGTICEVIVYNASFTTPQRQQVEGYLAWKWGLQGNLPADHPWKRWPPAP